MEPPRDEEGRIIMTKEYLRYLCEKEGLYLSPKLNSQLYLNHKGFDKISCLEPYVGVEALWLQGNCIEKIEGLSTLKNLRFLYLQSNRIEVMEGLEELTEVVRIDLSDNRINKIDCLAGLTKLKDIKMQNNRLSALEDIKGLIEVKDSLEQLDISGNKIEYDEELLMLFKEFNRLVLLSLKDNPLVEKFKSYRKNVIAILDQISYLDGNIIEDSERLAAEAFTKGGRELEQQVRKKLHEEKILLAKNQVEREREYYKKVDARVKRTLNVYKQEFIDKYRELLKRRSKLEGKVLERKGNHNRNMLKIIKVEKDMRNMMEENSKYLENEEKIVFKYADLGVEKYIDAIKPPKEYIEIQQQMTQELERLKGNEQKKTAPKEEGLTRLDIEEGSIPDLEEVIDVNKLKKEEFKWTEEHDKELKRLVSEHAFDFGKVQEQLLKTYPELDIDIDELCKRWSFMDNKEETNENEVKMSKMAEVD